MLTQEDFTGIVQNLTSHDQELRAIALENLWQFPSGDVKIIPYIKALLRDKTLCLLGIPYIFGEIRWLAAKALIAERERQGIPEGVQLQNVVQPLTMKEYAQARRTAQIALKGGIEGVVENLIILRDKGYLPMINLHLWPKVAPRQTETVQQMPVLVPA
jgi:HEAT repeat protein